MALTPKQQDLADKLTNLQKLTVLGVVKGKTQRQAYYDAGGRAKNDVTADACATEILSNPLVKEFYDAMLESVAEAAVLTREQALERLTLMASTEITDILEFRTVEVKKVGKDGEEETGEETIWLMKDSPEVERRARAAIKSVTMTKQGPKIEMYDANAAIAQIAKLQGWEAPAKVDHTSSDGSMSPKATIEVAELSDEQLAAIIGQSSN